MTVNVKLVGNRREIFTTESYVLGPVKELHPDILEATVYTDNGKKLAHIKRPHQKRYEKYEYKPLPPEPTRTPNADPKADTAQ